MYHLATFFVVLLSGLHVLAQTATTLSWDNNYGNSDLPLDRVACSGGPNGIETKYPQYATLGSLPSYPNVTAVYTVEGYDSAQCGACYAVTYGSTTANLLAVDRAANGFITSQVAMNSLTNNNAIAFGTVAVTFVQVPASECGLN